jgi:IgA Peptidase M64
MSRQALRLELWHYGTPRSERYEIARVVATAHADPHFTAALDSRGTYRWVLTSARGDVLASRGYSALFEEWQSTVAMRGDDAQMRMPESHAVPWVAGAGLEIQRRTAQGFASVFETRLPATAPEAAPRPATGELRHLHGKRGVTFLLVSEGYAVDEAERFFDAAERACRLLLAADPFSQWQHALHVSALFVPSRASGIPPRLDTATDTTNFASAYDTFGMARYLVCNDQHALHRTVDGCRWDALVVLANGTAYGGSGIFNAYACVASAMDSLDFDYVLPHELGHSFGGLGDEYFGKQITYSVDGDDFWAAWEPNVSTLGSDGRVKWSSLLDGCAEVPTPWHHAEFCRLIREVDDPLQQREQVAALLAAEPSLGALGVFEGARYRAHGVYRPEVDCRMFSKSARNFCAVCQDTIAMTLAAAAQRPA